MSDPGAVPAGDRKKAEEMLNRGLDYYDRDNFDVALVFYEKAVAADPSFALAYNNLGMTLIDLDRLDEAAAALTSALKINPDHAEAFNNLGFIYRRSGKDRIAAACYLRFMELEPEVEDAARIRQWIDDVAAQTGPIGPIDPSRDLSAQLPPPSSDGTVEPGNAETLMLQPDEPAPFTPPAPPAPLAPKSAEPPKRPVSAPAEGRIATMDKSAQYRSVAPASASPLDIGPNETAEAAYERALDFFADEDLDSVITLLTSVLKKFPDYEPAVACLGKAYVHNEDFENGLEHLARAIEIDPMDYSAFYVLGFALRALGQDAQAAEAYTAFLRGLPDATDREKIGGWVEKVTGVSQVAPPPAPVTTTTTAAQKASRPSMTKSQRPTFGKRQSEPEAEPEKQDSESAPATAAERASRAPTISQGAAGIVTSEPSAESAPAIVSYAEAGDAVIAPGMYAGYAPPEPPKVYSPETFEDEQEISDREASKFKQCLEQLQAGDADGAQAKLLKFIESNPAYAPAYLLMGRIDIRSRNYDQAIEHLKRAIRMRPDYEEAFYFIGQAYEKRGLLAEAKVYNEYCLTLQPDGPRAQRIREWLEEIEIETQGAQTIQCERCLRQYERRYVTNIDGKITCRNCLEKIEIETGKKLVEQYFPEMLAREAADETAADSILLEEIVSESHGFNPLPYAVVALGVIALIVVIIAILSPSGDDDDTDDPGQNVVVIETNPNNNVIVNPTDPVDNGTSVVKPPINDNNNTLNVDTTYVPTTNGNTVVIPINNNNEPPDKLPNPLDLTRIVWDRFSPPPTVVWPGATLEYIPKFSFVPDSERDRISWTVSVSTGAPYGFTAEPVGSAVRFRWMSSIYQTDGDAPPLADSYAFEATVSLSDKLRPDLKDIRTLVIPFKLTTRFNYEPDARQVNLKMSQHWTVNIRTANLMGSTAPDVIAYGGRFSDPNGLLVIETRVGNIRSDPAKLGAHGMIADIAVFDVNGDRLDDIVALDWFIGRLCVFQNRLGALSNRANDTWKTPKGLSQIIPLDINNDGLTDIVSAGVDAKKIYYSIQTINGFDVWNEMTDISFNFPPGLKLTRATLDDLHRGTYDGVLLFSAFSNRAELSLLSPDAAKSTLRIAVPTAPCNTGAMPVDIRTARFGPEKRRILFILTGGDAPFVGVQAVRNGFFQPFFGLDEREPAVLKLDRPNPVQLQVWDINKDGLDDLMVTWVDHIEIYWQQSDPAPGSPHFVKMFERTERLFAGKAEFVDLDEDGLPEILMLMIGNETDGQSGNELMVLRPVR